LNRHWLLVTIAVLAVQVTVQLVTGNNGARATATGHADLQFLMSRFSISARLIPCPASFTVGPSMSFPPSP